MHSVQRPSRYSYTAFSHVGQANDIDIHRRIAFLLHCSTILDKQLELVSLNPRLCVPVPVLANEVAISLAEKEVAAGQELHGTIVINYAGRWDSVVINSQIENS